MKFETAKKRAAMYHDIRAYFRGQGVLEVETPILSRGAAVDAHIDPVTAVCRASRSAGESFLLSTSPELFMKRLLCRGYPSVYQICRTFRDGESGRRHNPEFTMLEWYRRDWGWRRLMEETVNICRLALGEVPMHQLSYRDAFMEILEIDPIAASAHDLSAYIKAEVDGDVVLEEKGDQLDFIMSRTVEPRFPAGKLVVVHNYPQELGGLARLDADDPGTALRFEIYFNGLELCNGYEELLEGDEYGRRFAVQNRRRAQAGKQRLPADRNFLDALAMGLPPCSGNALGLDRLLMAALGTDRIEDVLEFPIRAC